MEGNEFADSEAGFDNYLQLDDGFEEVEDSRSQPKLQANDYSKLLQRDKVLFCDENCEIITPATNATNIRNLGSIELTKSKITFYKSQLLSSSVNKQSTSVNDYNSPSQANKSSSVSAVQGRSVGVGSAVLPPTGTNPSTPQKTSRRPSLNNSTINATSVSQLSLTITSESNWAYQVNSVSEWYVNDIINVVQRFYQLRYVGVEIFLVSRTSVFIKFEEIENAIIFQNKIRKLKPKYMPTVSSVGLRPYKILLSTAVTVGHSYALKNIVNAWMSHELSNFDYLMKLNSIAGRTYNDIGQYPVFPWVLADYKSDRLNLRDPKVFRDFQYPIGAQLESQRELLNSKYKDLNEAYGEMTSKTDDLTSVFPPFHFGSHYSVAGFVLWFLIRCEPFTTLHTQLQDGKFDKTDRLFHSMDATYHGCTTNASDVKELIPELFYLPESLINTNKFDFGVKQNGQRVDNVVLPPWAKNNPYEFIRLHREALESDYVSRHLHGMSLIRQLRV